MNLYKSLDQLFPVGANRTFGEVVSVSIEVILSGVTLGTISHKRKAWYVNASVNAFHMHRGLIRDFMEMIHGSGLSDKQIRRAKRLISLTVQYGYLINHLQDVQYSDYILCINEPPQGSSSMWRKLPDNEWAEIADAGYGLQAQFALDVRLIQSFDPELGKDDPSEEGDVSTS